MKIFIINTVLALVLQNLFFRYGPSVAFTGLTTLLSFIIIFFVLWLISFFYNRHYFRKTPKVINLVLFFLKELVIANLRVTWDIITPRFMMHPGVIAYPLAARTDYEITILANLISLTPGTLSLEVSEDRKILYFHAMYIKEGDMEAVIKEIQNGFEKKLLEITR